MSSRTKKYILTAVAILLLVGIAWLGILYSNAKSSNPSPKNDDKPVVKTLGDFRSINGTNYLIASVTGSNTDPNSLSELFSSGRWYGDSYGYSQYNVVFLDVVSEAVYPLLPTNDYQIISMEGFPKPVSDFTQSNTSQPTDPIAWWLFSIIKSDTNQDNKFSSLDKQTLSISDVGGTGYTEIIADVDDLLGTAYKKDDTLLIIYRSNEKNYLAHVDLTTRQVSSTEELPLGEEIK